MAARRVAPARRRLGNLVSTDETVQHPATSRRVAVVTDSTTYLPRSLIERWAIRQVSGPIVQTLLPGQEFTVDVLADRDYSLLGAVPRWRLQTKAGISTQPIHR